MRFLFGIILVLLGMYEVLGDIFPGSSCSCIEGYQEAKSSKMSPPDAFRHFAISPDFLPVPPQDELLSDFATANVELGAFIEPLRIIDPMDIEYKNGKAKVNYTLMLLDIDGPRGPAPNVYLSGLYVNVANSTNMLTSGDKAIPYSPPMPSLGSGVHRLPAILYEQNDYINPNDMEILKLAKSRILQLEQFAKTYNLNPEPVAGNFFTTELRHCLL